MFKHEKRVALIVLLYLMVWLTGCSPLILPTTYQVPNIKEKGDAQVDIAVSVSQMDNLHVAYSPIKHLVLATSVNYGIDRAQNSHNTKLSMFGGGYYHMINNNFMFSVYGRYGFGASTAKTYADPDHSPDLMHVTTIKYTDLQIQPQVLWSDKRTEVYSGLRFSLINTKKFDTNDHNRNSPGTMYILEPFLGCRGGFSNLKADFQMGIYGHKSTHIYSHPYELLVYGRESNDSMLNMSIGIAYMFNLKKKHFGIED